MYEAAKVLYGNGLGGECLFTIVSARFPAAAKD